MINRIHHVQITIPTGLENEARRFYGGVLGMTEMEKPESLKQRGGLWFAIGDQQLHIGTEDASVRGTTKAHVAYEVMGIDELRRKLTEHGVEVIDGIPIPGFTRFELRDPFGNRLELIERQ
jgi:catechol 2,3-dioxygenase-like lactoylglutathione lyase family enzyme